MVHTAGRKQQNRRKYKSHRAYEGKETKMTTTKMNNVAEYNSAKKTAYRTRVANILYRNAFEYFGTRTVEEALRYSILDYNYMEYLDITEKGAKTGSQGDVDQGDVKPVIATVFASIAHIDALLRKSLVSSRKTSRTNGLAAKAIYEEAGIAESACNDEVYTDDPQTIRCLQVLAEDEGREAFSQLVSFATELWNTGTVTVYDDYHWKTQQYQAVAPAWLNWVRKTVAVTHFATVGLENPDGDYIHEPVVEESECFQVLRDAEVAERGRSAHSRILEHCRALNIRESAVYDCICQDSGELDVRKVLAMRENIRIRKDKAALSQALSSKTEDKTMQRLASRLVDLKMQPTTEFIACTKSSVSKDLALQTAKSALRREKSIVEARKASVDNELAEFKAGNIAFATLSSSAKRKLSKERRSQVLA